MSIKTVLAVLISCGFVNEALPCSVVGRLPSPGELVDLASIIVHVRAVGVSDNPERDSWGSKSHTLVDFEVVDVLKGWISDRVISFEGGIASRDDFNDGPVPYRSVRPGGRSGSCYALNYRLGSHYLLLLRESEVAGRKEVSLTPYWSPLRPVNEQIRGPSDQWLYWVILRLNGRR
jgi:hypothetical protein